MSVERPSERFQSLEHSRRATVTALRQVDESTLLQLSHLTLPEIREIEDEVARVLPAGNLPAFVLSGLVKLKGRRLSSDRVRQDVKTLFRGLDLLPQGLYGIFVAGPAAVLYAYQKLLQLAGKDLTTAFPQGTWQFYLQFGLREDTARHVNETVGFHRVLSDSLDPVLAATAWSCAALDLLYDYEDLLAADWEERVKLRLLWEEADDAELAEDSRIGRLVRDWNERRPYHRPSDGLDYLAHRSAVFREFFEERLEVLPVERQERLRRRYETRREEALPAYQEQMSMLAKLEPERYYERRVPVPLWKASLGFVWQDHTYLLPVCQRDKQGSPLCFPVRPDREPPTSLYALSEEVLCDAESRPLTVDRRGAVRYRESGRLLGRLCPPEAEQIQRWLTGIVSSSSREDPPTLDLLLAPAARSRQSRLRSRLPDKTREEIRALQKAPVILNWDVQPHEIPLAYIRRGRRGIGDHPLTIFRTRRSMVFDQSHIFFDGMWGMAISEITTHGALQWYQRLSDRPPPSPVPSLAPLALTGVSGAEAEARRCAKIGGTAAESNGVDMRRLLRLRKWLRQRGVTLTVNDLLLLYRSFHAVDYRISPAAQRALDASRARAERPEARAALESIETTLAHSRETSPALLIPMDASNVSPHERVFPTTFRNPLAQVYPAFIESRDLYRACRTEIERDSLDYRDGWTDFDQARRKLLAYLKAFGEFLDAVKAVTRRGESFSTATIQLLAHLPPSMQHLLDQVPQRIGVLNEVIKGNEVFSNVGRVAPGTSLTRFSSAKDDGETKELVWGVLTDDEGRMQISLRDFRPFVPLLLSLKETSLADLLVEDYLESYVRGFNDFVIDLSNIVAWQGKLTES